MPLSNAAARLALAAPDVLSEPPRPVLRVVENPAAPLARGTRPRTTLEHRAIVIRDHGFRSFRVF